MNRVIFLCTFYVFSFIFSSTTYLSAQTELIESEVVKRDIKHLQRLLDSINVLKALEAQTTKHLKIEQKIDDYPFLFLEDSNLFITKAFMSSKDLSFRIATGPERFVFDVIIQDDVVIGLKPNVYSSLSTGKIIHGGNIPYVTIRYYLDMIPEFMDQAVLDIQHTKEILQVFKKYR